MRYEYTQAFSPEEQEHFLFDNKEQKTGLDFACDMIDNEITEMLKGKENLEDLDACLKQWH